MRKFLWPSQKSWTLHIGIWGVHSVLKFIYSEKASKNTNIVYRRCHQSTWKNDFHTILNIQPKIFSPNFKMEKQFSKISSRFLFKINLKVVIKTKIFSSYNFLKPFGNCKIPNFLAKFQNLLLWTAWFCCLLLKRFKVLSTAKHSRSQQKTNQRVLVLTLKFLALKKTREKYFPNFFKLFFTFILCNFLVRMLQYFQKNFKFSFCPWKHKKTGLKSCS